MSEPIEQDLSQAVKRPSLAPVKTVPHTQELERLLGQFRPYLRSLAEAELPEDLQAKLDPSDLVQETLLRGFQRFEQYRGKTEQELAIWLSAILRNYLADVRRSFLRGLRDVRREQPLVEVACPKSLTASDLARHSETKERFRSAMAALPDEYRQVLTLRQEHELTFPEIGQRMGRTADAVRMLWGRAILHLGKRLRNDDG